MIRRSTLRMWVGLAAGILASANTARAAQHLYHIGEVFSSADGSVQFIELTAEANQQGQFQGMFLCSGDPAIQPGQPGRQCFQFQVNLADANTSGRSLLFASPGYMALVAAQNLPTPDFVLTGRSIDSTKPFFDNVRGDRIRFLPQDNRTAEVQFPPLPTDGITSFNGPFTTRSNANMTRPMNLGMAKNSPRNFAGATGSVDASKLSAATVRAAQSDIDNDGVLDSVDLCPRIADPDQRDSDGDLVGDACDNCMLKPNPRVEPSPGETTTGGQIDDDADGIGNECDADFVRNGVVDQADLTLFMSMMGKPVASSTCGLSGNEPCAKFDVFPGANTIDAADLKVVQSLLGKASGPSCISNKTPCELDCSGPGCKLPEEP